MTSQQFVVIFALIPELSKLPKILLKLLLIVFRNYYHPMYVCSYSTSNLYFEVLKKPINTYCYVLLQ